MLWQMHESGAGPISPGIAHKILQLVQNNELTLVKKPVLRPQKYFLILLKGKRKFFIYWCRDYYTRKLVHVLT